MKRNNLIYILLFTSLLAAGNAWVAYADETSTIDPYYSGKIKTTDTQLRDELSKDLAQTVATQTKASYRYFANSSAMGSSLFGEEGGISGGASGGASCAFGGQQTERFDPVKPEAVQPIEMSGVTSADEVTGVVVEGQSQ